MEVASEDTKALKTDRLNRKMAAYGNIATPIIVAVVGGYFAYEDADAKSKSGGENWRIFNVMTVLLDLARGKQAIVFQHKSEISTYIDWATTHDNRTQAMANELKGRIR